MDIPSFVSSDLSQSVSVDGSRFEICIHRTSGQEYWTLEVINYKGKSFVWDDPFGTEKAALNAALVAFEKLGAAGFI
ncbi:hypothetical protein [Ruegeria atlantica]|uniref:Uncharacterized protein n=1 Tax=Ruegeria atlantica TaxID=81569 RepID=A0A0P1F1U9_9RHOB|nr:hypothetical protein [Ruegeria atlantica]CUH48750.1 hypothetical protein RUA4292_02939 [Ruegeria atlantica]